MDRIKSFLEIKEKTNKIKKILLKQNQKNFDILRSNLRKWNKNTKLINCDINSRIIQLFIRCKLSKLKDKIKNINDKLVKILNKRNINNNNQSLKMILNKWKNIINNIKTKENKSASMIQRVYL